MFPKSFLLFAILLVCAVCAVVWVVLSDREKESVPAGAVEQSPADSDDREVVIDTIEGASQPATTEPIEPRRIPFSGRAINSATGEPVTAYRITLTGKRSFQGRSPPSLTRLVETVNHAEGEFSLRLECGGPHVLAVTAAGFRPSEGRAIEIPESTGLSNFVIELEPLRPSRSIAGRVVEDATDAPVPGATVTAYWIEFRTADSMAIDQRGDQVETDRNGWFEIAGLPEGSYLARARHPDFVEARVDAKLGDSALEIRLGTGFHVFGQVIGHDGRPARAIEVSFLTSGLTGRCSVSTDSGGRYRSPPLPPGRISLKAAPAPGTSGSRARFATESRRAEIIDRDVEVNFGFSSDHVTWRGTLYDSGGEPVPRGTICIRWKSGQLTPASGAPFVAWRRKQTDERGGFEIEKLVPGTFELSVFPRQGRVRFNDSPLDEITFERGGVIDRDIRMRRTGLSGLVIDAVTRKPVAVKWCWIMAWCDKRLHYSAEVDNAGRFAFESIPPGRYSLTANGSGIAQGRLEDVVLNDGQFIDDLCIVVPLSGRLSLEVVGAESIAGQGFEMSLHHLETDTSTGFCNRSDGTIGIDENGLCELSVGLKTGSWTLALKHDDLGSVERALRISAGQTTEVLVTLADFSISSTDGE